MRELHDNGLRTMLDLKVNDIPRTAAAAVCEAEKLGVKLMTIHAGGGSDMISAASDEANEVEIIAVTVLTSLDDIHFEHISGGSYLGVRTMVRRYAEIALESGADGLVCSPLELDRLSTLLGSRVVPGVRPAGSDHGDQKRVATPKEAVDSGATWIVVGRPIVKAPDPLAAAKSILASL